MTVVAAPWGTGAAFSPPSGHLKRPGSIAHSSHMTPGSGRKRREATGTSAQVTSQFVGLSTGRQTPSDQRGFMGSNPIPSADSPGHRPTGDRVKAGEPGPSHMDRRTGLRRSRPQSASTFCRASSIASATSSRRSGNRCQYRTRPWCEHRGSGPDRRSGCELPPGPSTVDDRPGWHLDAARRRIVAVPEKLPSDVCRLRGAQ
jgi:hypothetical protein